MNKHFLCHIYQCLECTEDNDCSGDGRCHECECLKGPERPINSDKCTIDSGKFSRAILNMSHLKKDIESTRII